MKLLIVVPAYNEARVIAGVVKGIKKVVPEAKILVVDDGSEDETGLKAQRAGAEVITHVINRGLGGAIGTGLLYAQTQGFEAVITMDADGQHDAEDLLVVVKKLKNLNADVVIGSRLISQRGMMPWDRRVINWIANVMTALMFGVYTTDSQSGFRGFSRKAIKLIKIKTDRMEVSSEIFAEVKRYNLRMIEVPINVIYTSYSIKKGQNNLNSLSVLFRLMLRLFR